MSVRRPSLRKRLLGLLQLLGQPVAIVALLFAAQVVLYAVTVAHEGHLERVRRELRAQSEADVHLRADLASLRSLDRVETLARKMGLVSAKELAYLPPLQEIPARHALPIVSLGAAAAY